jgi:probable F420-dependent oxidoreductase
VKYTVTLPTDQVDRPEEFTTAAAVAEMATVIEEAGFDACNVTDHPFPSGAWVSGGGHHTLDPLVTLAVAATVTTRLRLLTNMFIPAYRNPFIAAKGIATLDALSQGRVIFGVAAGYLEEEFAALGASFDRRGRALEAAIDAMKQAWTGEPVDAGGPGWSARGNVMLPTPAARPHPPIWIGGNSPSARRRAAALGNGWAPFPARRGMADAVRTTELSSIDDLRQGIEAMRAEAERLGRREPLDVCVTPFSHPHTRAAFRPEVLAEEAESLAGLGVTWLTIHLPAPSRADFLRNARRFGAEIIWQGRTAGPA